MIYLVNDAGLCNRMRTIASAFTLAQNYNTSLTVIWAKNKALNCDFYRLFNPIPGLAVVSASEPWWRILKLYGEIRSSKSFININNTSTMLRKDLKDGKTVLIDSPHKFNDVNQYKCFVPLSQYKEQSKKIIGKNKNIIGLHIRRGDNKKSIEMSPLELFFNVIEQEIKKDDQTIFYLATDSEEEEEKIKNGFGDKIITNSSRELSRNDPKGIEDALIDLICLSTCRKIYGSYWSSFSETAAEWGGYH